MSTLRSRGSAAVTILGLAVGIHFFSGDIMTSSAVPDLRGRNSVVSWGPANRLGRQMSNPAAQHVSHAVGLQNFQRLNNGRPQPVSRRHTDRSVTLTPAGELTSSQIDSLSRAGISLELLSRRFLTGTGAQNLERLLEITPAADRKHLAGKLNGLKGHYQKVSFSNLINQSGLDDRGISRMMPHIERIVASGPDSPPLTFPSLQPPPGVYTPEDLTRAGVSDRLLDSLDRRGNSAFHGILRFNSGALSQETLRMLSLMNPEEQARFARTLNSHRGGGAGAPGLVRELRIQFALSQIRPSLDATGARMLERLENTASFTDALSRIPQGYLRRVADILNSSNAGRDPDRVMVGIRHLLTRLSNNYLLLSDPH